MRLRPALYATLALGLTAVTGLAGAAPAPLKKVPCLVDKEGDNDPPLDVLGAEIRTTSKVLTVTLKVKTTQTNSYTPGVLGMEWTFAFKIRGTDYSFRLERTTTLTASGATPKDVATSTFAGESGPVPTLDVKATSITWTVPRSTVETLKKPKQVLDNFAAMSFLMGGSRDTGISTAKYHDLATNCVA